MSIVLNLHVYLADIVRAFAYGLNGEFLDCHLSADDVLESLYGGIDRTVSGSGCLELLTGNVKTYAGNRLDAHTCSNLKVIELDCVYICTCCTGKHQDIVVSNFFLLVCKLEEFLINSVKNFTVDIVSIERQTVLKSGTSASCSQND